MQPFAFRAALTLSKRPNQGKKMKGLDYAESITSASRQNDRQEREHTAARCEKGEGIRGS